MKLLYISSYHPTLEYDDLKLFNELGIEFLSTGVYLDPKNANLDVCWKGALDVNVNPDWIEEFRRLNPKHAQHGPIYLSKEFVDKFDVVLCNFSFVQQSIIDKVWDVCKHKPFIYRTYCQQFAPFELKLQQYRKKGMKLLRGSERESTIGNYAGHDQIIRCYIDEDIYKGWKGNEKKVLSFSNDFRARIMHPNFECYRKYYSELKPLLPCDLYGNDTQCVGGGGFISPEKQMELYKGHRVYFSIGSPPATITYNFLEAWMLGAPVITFGNKIGNAINMSTYEAPYFIDNEENGFYSDNTQELRAVIAYLLENHEDCKAMGKKGRKKCKSLFGKNTIKQQWAEFFADCLSNG